MTASVSPTPKDTEAEEAATLFDSVPAPSPISTAVLSPDGRYRYRLVRIWQPSKPLMVWVMLNPSTADAVDDDQTIRRCKGYAKQEGCGGIVVVNLYAYRATQPEDCFAADDPIGPDCDRWLTETLTQASLTGGPVVAGWGVHAQPGRVRAFSALAASLGVELQCIGVTKMGTPRHPSRGSYVPLVPWAVAS